MVDKDIEFEEKREEDEIKNGIDVETTILKDLVKNQLESNVAEKTQLDYETNNNWLKFRKIKKNLQNQNNELKNQLLMHQNKLMNLTSAAFEGKSNQNYFFFTSKCQSIEKQMNIVWLKE